MTRALTVMQVLPALEQGGVERGTLEVARALAEAGHRSLVVSAGGRMVQALINGGSEHVCMDIGRKSPLSLRHVRPLQRLIGQANVDIVHARSRLPAWLAHFALAGLSPAARPRFVTTVHGFYSVSRYSEVMTRSNAVIAVSNSIARYISTSYPRCNASRVHVIHRGIDPLEFPYGFEPDAAWQRTWNEEQARLAGKRLLMLPGRVTRLKGHLEFVRLIGALIGRGRAVHGLIVGAEDPKRAGYVREVRALIARLGLGPHISWLGARADMRELYAVSDLVLSLSSKPESFGRTVLEALSVGTPCLGYDHGGVAEILAHLYPHGAVARGDGDQLIAHASLLLDTPPEVTHKQPFTLQDMLARTLSLYADVAGGGAPR